MTLKEARFALRCWGQFWSEKEMGLGFASRSIIASMMEIGEVGISARSDKHLYSHGSDGIYVPNHIAEVDHAIKWFCTVPEKILLRAVYVQKRQPTHKGKVELLKIENVIARNL